MSAVLLCSALISIAGAQQVQVRLHVPPPNQTSIENLWRVDLNNTTRNTYSCWLHAEAHEARQGLVFRANTDSFQLPPGRRQLRLRDVRVRDQWAKPGYEVFVLRTGHFPPGDYTYIVELEPDLGGDTGASRIENPTPPRLLAPQDDDSLRGGEPTFSWTRPGNYSGRVGYRFKIVEVRTGQTKEGALRSNPAWFEEEGIRAAQFLYPARARSLERSKRYAWQIEASFESGAPVLVSEVRGFSFAGFKPVPRVIWPLKATHSVHRYNNWYFVTLEIENVGSDTINNLVLVDSSVGFQCIDDVTVRYETSRPMQTMLTAVPCTVRSRDVGLNSAVKVRLDESPASWVLRPGQTLLIHYSAVPISCFGFSQGPWRKIGYSLQITGQKKGQTPVPLSLTYKYSGVLVEDIPQALASADYLIATSPSALYANNSGNTKSVDALLVMIGRLAKKKHGTLLYSGGAASTCRLLMTGVGQAMAPGWNSGGHLLIVGEQEIVPHFPSVRFFQGKDTARIVLNDYPYADWNDDETPELALGRIVGTTASDLMIPIKTSLDLANPSSGIKFDRSHALFISGPEPGNYWKFIRDMAVGAQNVYLRWHGATGIDTVTLHTDYLTVKKRQIVHGLFSIDSAAGGAIRGRCGDIEGSYTALKLAAWLLGVVWNPAAGKSSLDFNWPPRSQDTYFYDCYGRTRRLPYGNDFMTHGISGAAGVAEGIMHGSAPRGGIFGAYHYYGSDIADFSDARAEIRARVKTLAKNKDVIVWVGHSGPGGWGDVLGGSEVQALGLTTTGTRPFVLASGCNTGHYDGSGSITRAFLKYGAAAYYGAVSNMIGGDNDLRFDWWSQWSPTASVGQGLLALKRYDRIHAPRTGPNNIDYDTCEHDEALRYYLYQMYLFGDAKIGGQP
jgi:hypothetical protein